jgi:hypothetical protein
VNLNTEIMFVIAHQLKENNKVTNTFIRISCCMLQGVDSYLFLDNRRFIKNQTFAFFVQQTICLPFDRCIQTFSPDINNCEFK